MQRTTAVSAEASVVSRFSVLLQARPPMDVKQEGYGPMSPSGISCASTWQQCLAIHRKSKYSTQGTFLLLFVH